MSGKTSVVRVFLASPGDLGAEREIVEELVNELNGSWGHKVGIALRLVRWERDVRPGVGDDAQAVVNSQVPDDYEVFIGLLWGRFGTPTLRYSSGTHEEFERAIARWKESGSPEIMMYFKDAPLRPLAIDTDQVAQVQAFRKSLTERGVLFWPFEDQSGFQSSLRAHLASLVQRRIARRVAAPAGGVGTPAVRQIPPRDAIDDLGYFDHLENYNTRMAAMTAAMEVISAATVRIGEQMSASAEQMREHTRVDGSPAGTMRLLSKSANDMNEYAEVVRAQVPVFSVSRDQALESLTKALPLYEEFDSADVEQLALLEDSLSRMLESAQGSRESLHGMRMSIDALPRLTVELNRAKRLVCSELDGLLASIDKTVSTTGNIVDSIRSMRERRA